MPFFRTLAIFLLLSAVILLTGALNSRPTETSQVHSTAGSNPAAVKLLDDALARLHPNRLTWLETGVWQKVRLGKLAYESEGRYLIGPDRRLRLELATHSGNATATLLVVSDGKILWEGQRLGNGDWTDIACLNWQNILQASGPASSLAPNQEELISHPSFGGVLPLLQGLRTRLVWTQKETVRRGGSLYFKLAGRWPDQRSPAGPDGTEPGRSQSIHECRLYLDSQSLWPHRVEWWGADGAPPGDSLLLQMEFRHPVVNRLLSPEQCLREFSFPAMPPPATPPVPELAAQLRARARQLLAQ